MLPPRFERCESIPCGGVLHPAQPGYGSAVVAHGAHASNRMEDSSGIEVFYLGLDKHGLLAKNSSCPFQAVASLPKSPGQIVLFDACSICPLSHLVVLKRICASKDMYIAKFEKVKPKHKNLMLTNADKSENGVLFPAWHCLLHREPDIKPFMELPPHGGLGFLASISVVIKEHCKRHQKTVCFQKRHRSGSEAVTTARGVPAASTAGCIWSKYCVSGLDFGGS